MKKKRVIAIRDTFKNNVLANGIKNEQVEFFEGAWYFDQDVVDMTFLDVTNRTFVCPYKGTCYWIDLHLPNQTSDNVAFTYFDVNPGYEFIQNKIGFYAGKREATIQESTDMTEAVKIDN